VVRRRPDAPEARLDAEVLIGGRLGPGEAAVLRMYGRLALHAAPAVLGALRALPDALSTYAQGAGHDLALQADPLRAPGEEMVAPAA